MYPESHYHLLQAIMSPDNAPVHNRHRGHLKLSFISMCAGYLFTILLLILPLYLIVILEYNWWNYHRYMIVCYNTQKWKVACGTIQRCGINWWNTVSLHISYNYKISMPWLKLDCHKTKFHAPSSSSVAHNLLLKNLINCKSLLHSY